MRESQSALSRLARLESWVFKLETALIVVLFPILVTLTFLQVLARYIFNYPLPWTEELAIGLFIWVAFVGSAMALAQGGHFGLELLKNELPHNLRIPVEIAIWGLSASFLVVVVIYGIGVVLGPAPSMTALPISMRWFFSAVPVGASLMLLHLGFSAGKAIAARVLA